MTNALHRLTLVRGVFFIELFGNIDGCAGTRRRPGGPQSKCKPAPLAIEVTIGV